MRDMVQEYITMCLEEEAIKKVFAREDVSAVADAKELLDKAFMKLKEEYGIKEAAPEVINHAK